MEEVLCYYEEFGANGGNYRPQNKVIEIYFEDPDGRDEALDKDYEFNNIKFEPMPTFSSEDRMIKINIHPLPMKEKQLWTSRSKALK